MESIRKVNLRSEDLAIALRSGYRNKRGHSITITDSLHPPSFEFCKDCEFNFSCLSHKQITVQQALCKDRPCYQKENYINFHYYHERYLLFDRIGRRVTDTGMYRRVSTMFEIDHTDTYPETLQALKDNFNYLRLYTADIERIINAFTKHIQRHRRDVLWIDV